MRLITNQELAFVSGGGDWVTDDGKEDQAIGAGSVSDFQQDGQFNPIAIAIIGAVAVIAAAVVAAIVKSQENDKPVVTKVVTTTMTCQPDPNGNNIEVCTVTGKTVTETTYEKK